jgi:hypothetical protein
MPVIPTLGGQRQDLCEFRASLLYWVHITMTSQMPLASVFTHCGVCVYELRFSFIRNRCALKTGEPSLTYFENNSIARAPYLSPGILQVPGVAHGTVTREQRRVR